MGTGVSVIPLRSDSHRMLCLLCRISSMGDTIFSAPMDLALWHSRGEELNNQSGEKLDENTPIAVRLLRERAQKQRSRYYPYIQVRSSQQDLNCCGAARKRGSSSKSRISPCKSIAGSSRHWACAPSCFRVKQQPQIVCIMLYDCTED